MNMTDGFTISVDGEEQQISDSAIKLTAEQLESAQLSAPDGFEGDASLTVSVTSTESENGDTATTVDSLDLSFVSNDTPVVAEENPEVGYDNTIDGGSRSDKL